MIQRRTGSSRKVSTQKAYPWSGLDDLCKKVHAHLYVKRDRSAALRYRARLEQILARLPKNDIAILKAEGNALLSELCEDHALAVKYRKKELQLIMRLYVSVVRSVADGECDARVAKSLLKHWGLDALEARRNILSHLQRYVNSAPANTKSDLQRMRRW